MDLNPQPWDALQISLFNFFLESIHMDILALRSVRNIPSQVAPIPFFQAGQEEVSIPPVPAAVRSEALLQRSGRIMQSYPGGSCLHHIPQAANLEPDSFLSQEQGRVQGPNACPEADITATNGRDYRIVVHMGI